MKINNIFNLFIVLFLATFLVGCNEDNELSNESYNKALETEGFELTDYIIKDASTENITNFSKNFNVSKLIVNEINYEYSFQTAGETEMNEGQDIIDFSEFTFIVKDEMLFIESYPNIKLTVKNGELYIIDAENNLSDYFSEGLYSSLSNQLHFDITYTMLTELLTEEVRSTNVQVASSDYCKPENISRISETGFTRSSAEQNTRYMARTMDSLIGVSGSSCVRHGTIDVSCGWGNHLCAGTQQWCCPKKDWPLDK